MSLDDDLRNGTLSRRRFLKLSGVAGLSAVLAACGQTGPGTPDPDPNPDPDPDYDPTLPPENSSGMSASEYWKSEFGENSPIDLSKIKAGSEDNSVAPFLHWLHDRMERPRPGGSIGMIPEVAQTYVDRFGRFGNISDQAMIVLSEYFARRDILTQTPDQRSDSGEMFIHPDTYVDGWDVGIWTPHHGDEFWFPIRTVSRPNQTGLDPNPNFNGYRYLDLNATPNSGGTTPENTENVLSALGFDRCRGNVTQDWPIPPGFDVLIREEYADSLPGGVPLFNPFPWPLVVEDIRAYPGNTQINMKATQIDRAVWDAEFHLFNVAHLAPPPTRNASWVYDNHFDVPAEGQVIPPFTNGSRSVIASLSTELSSRFSDTGIYAAPSFGASRKSNGGEYPDHHIIDPLDMQLPDGKRMGVADGGIAYRPVADPNDPTKIVAWDPRAQSPCARGDGDGVYQPDRVVSLD